MDWKTLLSAERSRNGSSFKLHEQPSLATNFLTDFSRDPDRVSFSSAFRRLQGKTQVYMFPQTDFVRNRLTHSLEVASIGRNLIAGIYKGLMAEKTQFKKANVDIPFNDLSDIVAAACLAHDLGNPPFGHIGEYAIRSWFKENFSPIPSSNGDKEQNSEARAEETSRRPALDDISAAQRMDFELFDGNAQSFRLVTRMQNWSGNGGLRLTAATLGALVKYPNTASSKTPFKKGKFGVYNDDLEIFEALAGVLQLKKKGDGSYARHPLAFVTEAADDIAYLTSDIEDARKFGVLSFEEAEELLLPAAKLLDGFSTDEFERIEKGKVRLKFLRSTAALAMIDHCAKAFVRNEEKILSGEMTSSLLSSEGKNRRMQAIETDLRKKNQEKIYHMYRKVKAEAGAYEVIRSMLTDFSDAVENKVRFGDKPSERSQNLLCLVDHTEPSFSSQSDPYKLYLGLVDYVSGMTDRYAIDICETLCGRKLSLGY
ncbi:MAG: hypothetical protein DI528_18550 [Shinella sp.]|nr:MAG: hypothetical protein DI528_18550 [Shinella sp.]